VCGPLHNKKLKRPAKKTAAQTLCNYFYLKLDPYFKTGFSAFHFLPRAPDGANNEPRN
jgi:hypothetical protein